MWRHDDQHVVVSSPVFAGTNLEGTEVNGLAAEVLPFLSILRPRSTFYDTAATTSPPPWPTGRRSSAPATRSSMVLAEDFEDVNGMARQVGLAADLVDALPGDHRRPDLAGLAVETYIVDTVDFYSRTGRSTSHQASTTPPS